MYIIVYIVNFVHKIEKGVHMQRRKLLEIEKSVKLSQMYTSTFSKYKSGRQVAIDVNGKYHWSYPQILNKKNKYFQCKKKKFDDKETKSWRNNRFKSKVQPIAQIIKREAGLTTDEYNIILESLDKPKRYSQLKHLTASDKTLAERIKELTKHKLIETVSLKSGNRFFVHYKITEKGEEILKRVKELTKQ